MISDILEKYPCDGDCRFRKGYTISTLVAYLPRYDKEGVNSNPDGNATTTELTCEICSKRFLVKEKFGKIDAEIIL